MRQVWHQRTEMRPHGRQSPLSGSETALPSVRPRSEADPGSGHKASDLGRWPGTPLKALFFERGGDEAPAEVLAGKVIASGADPTIDPCHGTCGGHCYCALYLLA